MFRQMILLLFVILTPVPSVDSKGNSQDISCKDLSLDTLEEGDSILDDTFENRLMLRNFPLMLRRFYNHLQFFRRLI